MNKKSLAILKHLASRNMPVSLEYLTNRFGYITQKHIQELVDIEYVREDTQRVYTRTGADGKFIHNAPSGLYRITGAGRAFLECRISNGFERWATLALALVGAITGILALFS